MVSIFADKIYDETVTVTLSGGVDVHTEMNAEVNFPIESVGSTLGGFTYAETVVLTLEFVTPLTYDNSFGVFSEFVIGMQPRLLFGNNDLDLFGLDYRSVERFGGGDNQGLIADGSHSTSVALDSYIDTPADLDPGFEAVTDPGTPGGPSEVQGTQTIDFRAAVSIIGRQP